MVLVFIDQSNGHIKKSSFEAANYASAIAKQLNTSAEGLLLGTVIDDLTTLGKYGLTKVHTLADAALNNFDAQVYTGLIAQAAENADIIVFSNNTTGKAIAPRLSVKIKAGLVSGAVALPETSNGFTVKKTVFSGKAFANISVSTAKKIIALKKSCIRNKPNLRCV